MLYASIDYYFLGTVSVFEVRPKLTIFYFCNLFVNVYLSHLITALILIEFCSHKIYSCLAILSRGTYSFLLRDLIYSCHFLGQYFSSYTLQYPTLR
jgi:hypothetical protein